MLLAIETATRVGSVALLADGEVVAHRVLESGDNASSLASTVRDLLDGRASQVAAYAVSIGPGSFTGLRIGVALIKGMAIVFPRPVIAVPTLRVLAVQSACGGSTGGDRSGADLGTLVLCDARGGEAYAGHYGPDGLPSGACEDGLWRIDDVARRFADTQLTVTGDLAGRPGWPGGWSPAPAALWRPDAATVARLAVDLWAAGATIEADDLAPAYHQSAAAERKLEAARRPA